ncbi:MAG: lipoate--protein ligase [Bacillota bacterium]|nr:lipoate--protein ligase [Bacillota bacterium]
MKYVNYPTIEVRNLSFYLATEEYLALHYPADDYFFMWQVEPSVIFGRNQLIENEVNVPYCTSHGIKMYRRKSGGGCVYSDASNIMFSFVTPSFNQSFVFEDYLNRVVRMLKKLGLDAHFSGRNDILIGDLKVSGNAFYRVRDRSVVHGTMLFATDVEVMVRAITPDNEKLVSKGIDSVRKRVTNLKDHLTMSIEDFKAFVKREMCDGSLTLTVADLAGIAEIEKSYLTEDFIYGKNPNYTIVKKGYVNAGTIEVRLELKNNEVIRMNLLGDYFLIGDQDEFLALFRGLPFTREAFVDALSAVDLGDYVMKLNTVDFCEILFGQNRPML